MQDDLKSKLDIHISLRINELAEKIVEEQYNLQPEFWKPYGSEGRRLSVRDAGYHLPFLTEAVLTSDPAIFTNYVAWVRKLFKGLNFPDEVMIKTLECTRSVLVRELPSGLSAILSEYIGYGLDEMYKPVHNDETYIREESPLYTLAAGYLEALLKGNRHAASKMILEEAQRGTSIKSIYLEVFQKTQYEIGRLWLANRISVAQEHYCSAATQVIMSQLYPYIFSSERKGLSIVTACVGGELHELGVRMVTDFFEMEGWDSYYLGANTPASAILRSLKEYRADVLGLSAAMPYHISLLKETIARIRNSGHGRDIFILVGGNAINNSNLPPSYFMADGLAKDATGAVTLAGELIKQRK